MSDKKFIQVDQELTNGSLPWLIDVSTVVRVMPENNFVVFDDGAAMNITSDSMEKLAKELEALS